MQKICICCLIKQLKIYTNTVEHMCISKLFIFTDCVNNEHNLKHSNTLDTLWLVPITAKSVATVHTHLSVPGMPGWAAWMLIFNAVCMFIVYLCSHTFQYITSHCIRLHVNNELLLPKHNVCYCALGCWVMALVYARLVHTPVLSTRVYCIVHVF